MNKVQRYLVSSGIVSWVIALIIAIVLVAMGQSKNLNEAFFGSFIVVYALRCVWKFFTALSDITDDGTFSGSIRFVMNVLKAFMKCLKPAIRCIICIALYGLVGKSVGFENYQWIIPVSLFVSAIPWRNKTRTT